MQILHICSRFTPRPLKLIMAQQGQGHNVQLLYMQDCQPEMFPYVMYPTQYRSEAQFQQKIQMFAPITDVIWVHTCITNVDLIDRVHQALPCSFDNKPKLVWDIHDFVAHEMNKDIAAIPDYIVTPGNAMANQVMDHRCSGIRTIYNKCPQCFDVDAEPIVKDSVVLTSAVEATGGNLWRDYTGAQEIVRGMGKNLFIYSANRNESVAQHYDFLMCRLPLTKMIKSLSYYEYGWCGAANEEHNIDVCVTNKFWEYLAAGVPVMTFNCKEMEEIVDKLDVRSSAGVRLAKLRGEIFLEDDQGYQRFMKELEQ